MGVGGGGAEAWIQPPGQGGFDDVVNRRKPRRPVQATPRQAWFRHEDRRITGAPRHGFPGHGAAGRPLHGRDDLQHRQPPAQSEIHREETGFIDRDREGRDVRAREVGDLMAFLASDRAGYTSGVIYTVDGGFSAGWG